MALFVAATGAAAFNAGATRGARSGDKFIGLSAAAEIAGATPNKAAHRMLVEAVLLVMSFFSLAVTGTICAQEPAHGLV